MHRGSSFVSLVGWLAVCGLVAGCSQRASEATAQAAPSKQVVAEAAAPEASAKQAAAASQTGATAPVVTAPVVTAPVVTGQGAAASKEEPMDPLLAAWKDIPIDPQTGTVTLTEAQWRERLSPEQYRILRQKGTERPFTGKLWDSGGAGEYRCAACGNLLFTGDDKFVSECGWPAFEKAIKGSIRYETDRTYGMIRTETMCNRCGGHLGHVFEDGPTETGTRYCINSVSIVYIPGTTSSKSMETEAIVEAPPAQSGAEKK
ncbi:MAG TPA: peptide-methionine (R)-S-oxide reductase MsrB [Phycisphaerales bacterium]|nr:peptide-methionine (R)-S-oxide reductase MsrB [Phycisphaerales bacterium]